MRDSKIPTKNLAIQKTKTAMPPNPSARLNNE